MHRGQMEPGLFTVAVRQECVLVRVHTSLYRSSNRVIFPRGWQFCEADIVLSLFHNWA